MADLLAWLRPNNYMAFHHPADFLPRALTLKKRKKKKRIPFIGYILHSETF